MKIVRGRFHPEQDTQYMQVPMEKCMGVKYETQCYCETENHRLYVETENPPDG